MTMVDDELLLAHVVARTGTDDRAEARRAVTSTIAALLAQLTRAEVLAVAEALPRALIHEVRLDLAGPWSDDPFADLARHARLAPAVAIEYAIVVCEELAAILDPQTRHLLEVRLPMPWRELFHRRVAVSSVVTIHQLVPRRDAS